VAAIRDLGSSVVPLLVGCWLAGCQDSNTGSAAVHVLNVSDGSDCTARNDLPGSGGQCSVDEQACDVGWFDGDGVAANGCEEALDPSAGDSFFRFTAYRGLGALVINDYPVSAGITGGALAVSGPPCVATIGAPCSYDLRAFQVTLAAFTFDGAVWADGVLELPRPLAVKDDGEGLVVPAGADMIARFVVGGGKSVISRGLAEKGIVVNLGGDLVVASAGFLHFGFGGYTIDGDATTIVVDGQRFPPSQQSDRATD
jgi:hypothetical protein